MVRGPQRKVPGERERHLAEGCTGTQPLLRENPQWKARLVLGQAQGPRTRAVAIRLGPLVKSAEDKGTEETVSSPARAGARGRWPFQGHHSRLRV